MRAPACTSTLPAAPVKRGCRWPCPGIAVDALRPELVVGDAAAAATRLRVSVWLLPLNTMPLRFAISTVPSALIRPWICEGRACGSLTRLSTAQLGCCLKSTVVLRPTLKVSQLRIACGAVCCDRRPASASPLRDCTGALALSQPAVRLLPCPRAARHRPGHREPRDRWPAPCGAPLPARPAAPRCRARQGSGCRSSAAAARPRAAVVPAGW
jgi:hypothetical protein